MSANKPKTVNNCLTSDDINCGVSNRSSCGSPSPTKPEAKKIPPIKAPVGLARGPDLKNVKSKIGSLQNVKYKPTGGEKKVESQKLAWHAKPRVGSLDNAKHKPRMSASDTNSSTNFYLLSDGSEVRVVTQKLDWKAQSKVGSLDNVKHSPGGGQIKIFDEKYAKSPSSTPTPCKSGSMTPDGKENGDTLKTLTGVRESAEKLEIQANNGIINSPKTANDSLKSTPNSSASSMRTGV